MASYKKKQNFFETDEGHEFERTLASMVESNAYNTQPSYSANAEQYPNHLIPFVNKHMEYLASHPSTDPDQYLSNLRLMTRVR